MAFPDDETVDLVVEADLGGQWVDLSSRLVGQPVQMTRGKPDGARQAATGSCRLILDDSDGALTPLNPIGAYYPHVRRGVGFRVGYRRVVDDFSRTVTGGWGTTSDSKSAWLLDGTPADFDVGAGVGTIAGAGTSIAYTGDFGDVEVLAKFSFNNVSGDPQYGVVTHYRESDGAHWRFSLDSIGTDTLRIEYRLSSGVYSFPTTAFPMVPGTQYWMRVSSAKRQRVKVWADGDPEPDDWMVDVHPASSSYGLPGILPTHGAVGFSQAFGDSTNLMSVDSVQIDTWLAWGDAVTYRPRLITTTDGTIHAVQQIDVAGPSRRIQQGASPLLSAFRRDATKQQHVDVVTGYWPCEDEDGATSIASGLPGGQAMRIVGDLNFAADSATFPGSAPLLKLDATGIGPGKSHLAPSTGVVAFRGLFSFPAAGLANGVAIADVWQVGSANVARWRLTYHTSSGGALQLRPINHAGAFVGGAATGEIAFGVNGKALMIGFTVVQDGSDVDWHVFGRYVADQTVFELGLDGTFSSLTVASPADLYVAPDRNMADCVVGHFLVGHSAALASGIDQSMIGYRGETAAARIQRLCEEEGVAVAILGDPADSAACGPQGVASLPQLLEEAADADGGVLGESRHELGIEYRPRASMYNQPTALTVNLATYRTSKSATGSVLTPVYDDQGLRNDVEVTRTGGSSYRAADAASIAADQRYDDEVEVNVATDDQLPDVAGWLLRLGAVDEYRNPSFSLDLAANPDLISTWTGTDVGDQVQRTNPPHPHPPETIDQLLGGYAQTIGPRQWIVSGNTEPAAPWHVAEVFNSDAEHGFVPRVAGGDDMVLAAAVDADDTALLVSSVSGDQRWATSTDDAESSADFPMDAMVGGERVTVTDVDPGLIDTFSRTESNGWGTPTTSYPGTAYSVAGTASDYSVVGGTTGRIAATSVGTLYLAHVDCGSGDGDLAASVVVPVLPTGASITARIAGRLTDGSNYYEGQIDIATTGVVSLAITKRVAGVGALLTSLALTPTHSAGDQWRLRLAFHGSTLKLKAWKPASSAEPGWQLITTDTDLTTGTRIGALCRLETGNTNGTVNIDWDDFEMVGPQTLTVTRSVNGIAKSQAAGEVVEVFEPAYVAR